MATAMPIKNSNYEYSLRIAKFPSQPDNAASPSGALTMEKFGFRIQTRSGLTVDNLIIQAADQTTAEARLKQMYLGCTILEAKILDSTPHRGDMTDLEGVINLISGQNKPG
jgi:hypothetical protein